MSGCGCVQCCCVRALSQLVYLDDIGTSRLVCVCVGCWEPVVVEPRVISLHHNTRCVLTIQCQLHYPLYCGCGVTNNKTAPYSGDDQLILVEVARDLQLGEKTLV